MTLRDSIIISADASAIWEWIADPIRQAEWNPKIDSIDRKRTGPAIFRERFEMIYRMSGRDDQSIVDVIVLEPDQRIVFQHRTTWKTKEYFVTETYDIASQGQGMKVTQTIDLSRAGIAWPLRFLIWIITRFGKPTGETYLHRLKVLVEQSVSVG